MTKRERILAAIAGSPVDRVPYSLWYHFRLDPPAGEEMIRAELDFYHKYDPDLFKVMHDIPYEMPLGLQQVAAPGDWDRLRPLDGVSGNFAEQLHAVKQIMVGRGDDGPTVDTIFGVFSTAEKLCGKRTLELLQADPIATHRGLDTICASLCNYARALVAGGGDGIYLAISGAARDTMSSSDYAEHFLTYDQRVLDAAAGASVNVAHHHGSGIYPELVLGLHGFHVYSWSDRLPENPSVAEMRLRTSACLMGGVDETNFGTMSPDDIVGQVREAIASTNSRGLIAAPGCAAPTPPDSSEQNLRAVGSGVTC